MELKPMPQLLANLLKGIGIVMIAGVVTLIFVAIIFMAPGSGTHPSDFVTISFLDLAGNTIKQETVAYGAIRTTEYSKVLVYESSGKLITYTGPYRLERELISNKREK